MKFFKGYIIIIVFLTLLVSSIVVGIFWYKNTSLPVSESSQEITFVVPKGTSATQIGSLLKEKGLIKNELAFKIRVQLGNLSGSIQAGEYTLDPAMSLEQIITELTSGPEAVWVTIPEGYRREQIASTLINSFGLTGVNAQSFYDEFIHATEGLEGTLFPDTYLFEKDTQVQRIVSVLTNTYEVKTADLGINQTDLIIASLIEREAITEDEKPVIAGIIRNRIDDGMGLNIDATLQYLVANERCSISPLDCEWWKPPTAADKKIDSAYNTYIYSGLPPSPIANPGLTALQAAINPQVTEYYYYLHDPEGQIYYAQTLEEHNQNINKYLK